MMTVDIKLMSGKGTKTLGGANITVYSNIMPSDLVLDDHSFIQFEGVEYRHSIQCQHVKCVSNRAKKAVN